MKITQDRFKILIADGIGTFVGNFSDGIDLVGQCFDVPLPLSGLGWREHPGTATNKEGRIGGSSAIVFSLTFEPWPLL
jgi:hypothetical protein